MLRYARCAAIGLLLLGAGLPHPAQAAARPDLVVASIVAPTTKNAGQVLAVTSTVRNRGTVKAAASKVRTWLSLDTTPGTTGDRLLGTRSVTTLGAGKSATGRTSYTLPTTIRKGRWNLIVCADATRLVRESIETNNCRVKAFVVNRPPVATNDVVTGSEDTAVPIATSTLLANDTDPDPVKTLTVIGVTNGTGGTVALSGTTATFTPQPNRTAPASFGYQVRDSLGLTDTAVVTVNLSGSPDAPVAVADVVVTPEDTAAEVSTGDLLGNDTDPDGDALTVTAVSDGVGGLVGLAGGTVTFTPFADRDVDGSFSYTLSDGTFSTSGTVTVDITPVNDTPVATDDAVLGVTEDTVVQLTTADLVGNDTDADGDTLTVTAASDAVGGTVGLAAGTVTFTPSANRTATSSFTYTVSDGTLTDTANVTISWTPVNDAPVAADDVAATAYQTPVNIAATTLAANDTDAEGDSLLVTLVSNPTNGTVSLTSGTVQFTPGAGFSGTAGFDYTVSDGSLTDAGHVTVTVGAPSGIETSVTSQTLTKAGSATVGVRLTGAPLASVTVSVTSSDTGAFTVSPATLTFTPANWSTYQNVTVSGTPDIDLTNESGTLTLSSPAATTKQVGITVTDDDTQAIVVSPAAGLDVDEGASSLVSVHLAFQPTSNVSLTISSSDPSVATVNTSLLTFTAANFATDQSIVVTGVTDADLATEGSTLTLSLSSGQVLYYNVTVHDTGP